MAILITLIRLLMFIGNRAKAVLSLPIDFTSKNAYSYCNCFVRRTSTHYAFVVSQF